MNELHLVQMNRISFRQLSEYSMANCVEDKVVLVDNLSLFPFGKSKECFIAADFIALLFCTEGHLEMNMDGRHYTLSKGDVLFCGQGVTLQGITMSTSCQGKVLCLSWEYGQILFLRSTYQWNSILQLRHNPLLQSSIEEQKLYRAYYQLFAAKLNCYYYVSGNIDCIFQGFFNDLYRMADRYIMQKTQQDTYPTSLRQEDLFKRFITLVKEKHGHEHFCSFYAGQLCVTSKHLTKVVKTVSGKSVSQWISTYLMEQIIFYLKTTNLTIAEIAYKLNFSNASFFGQYVKSARGNRLQSYDGHCRQYKDMTTMVLTLKSKRMFNLEIIKQNSRRVYNLMKQMYRYTFKELEQVTSLDSTDLCLALIELQREGRLEYGKSEAGIYYARA